MWMYILWQNFRKCHRFHFKVKRSSKMELQACSHWSLEALPSFQLQVLLPISRLFCRDLCVIAEEPQHRVQKEARLPIKLQVKNSWGLSTACTKRWSMCEWIPGCFYLLGSSKNHEKRFGNESRILSVNHLFAPPQIPLINCRQF